MEILSNIWNILTTENEMISDIFTVPTIPIEAWILFQLATSLLKIDYTKKKELQYILCITFGTILTKFFIPEPVNIFTNYLIMFITIKFTLKTNILKTILCIIVPTIVFALTTTLILHPFMKLFNLTYEQNSAIPIYQLSYLFGMYIILFFLLLIIKFKKLKFGFLDDLTTSNKRIIIFNLVLGFFILFMQIILNFYYLNIVPIGISFLNFFVLCIYFFISFYSLNRTMKLQITTKNLETAENYNETLTYLYDNVKAFKHDFDNMVFVLGGFIESNDINKIKKYYKNLEKDCERVNNIALLNPKLINNSGVYNLLMSKYKKASEYNVEIKLEYFFDLEKLNMPIYEFSRILGILLDNALEAAKDSKEKQIHILFRDSQRNNTQIISIENSYSNKDVDTSKIFEKGKTSKENHTGMGLWEVKQILNRNNNVNLITTKDEKYFKQSIEIYY